MNNNNEDKYKLVSTRIVESPKEVVESKEVGIGTRIKDLEDKLNMVTGSMSTDFKKKSFKFPRMVKAKTKNIKKLLESDQIQVILLKENRALIPTIGKLHNGMLILGNKAYDGSIDIIWLWNGKVPTALVAEWDLKPLTPEYLHIETVENRRSIHPQTIIIRAMEMKEALQKGKGVSGKMVMWLVIAAIVIGFLLFYNQG